MHAKPDGHSLHAFVSGPTAVIAYFPEAHTGQKLLLAVEYVPFKHTEQETEPAAAKNPASQSMGAALLAQAFPGGQTTNLNE